MADKLHLEYVISACGMMGVFSTPIFETEARTAMFKRILLGMMQTMKESLYSNCSSTRPIVSALYNGYTEKQHVECFEKLDNLGAHSIYADSGGLQIVTAGKSVTTEIKAEIYKQQAYADYAMCFDVIPLTSIAVTRTRNERSNVGNKVFNQDEHSAAGVATGQNIKAQTTYFRSIGAKTKVIMIIQGNTPEDMVDYFNQIASQLEPEDYDNIGGMAVADTCMGNGERESIDMLKGARAITKICHPNVNRHLHILGVGSLSRLRPILYLINSGYLDSFERVSYDSSSHTSCFDYGLLKLNGTCKPLGGTWTPAAEAHFTNAYNLFKEPLSEIVTLEEFLWVMFGDDKSGDWKYSTIKKRSAEKGEDRFICASILTKAVHTYFMINNFVINADKICTEDPGTVSSVMRALKGVKNDEDMLVWEAGGPGNSTKVRSKRIVRQENLSTLDDFWS